MARESWATVSLGPTLSFLQRLQAKASKLQPVFNGPIANAVHAFFEKRFASEGAYGGTKWAPLAERTLVWRAQHHRSKMPILQFTRDLWGSLTKRSSPLGYRIATDDSLIMGTSVKHAEKHQLGQREPVVVPARPIVPATIPEEDTEAWARLIVEHIEAA